MLLLRCRSWWTVVAVVVACVGHLPRTDGVYDCTTDPAVYQTEPIAPWELRRVGIIGASTVPAVETVLTRATLNGTVYFEADPATQASDEYFAVELYTIPGAYDASSSEEAEEATATSDCAAQGVRLATGLYTSVLTVTPLASDDYNTVYPADTSAECFPQTTTGAVYQFDFSITDPLFGLPGDQAIYNSTSSETEKTGVIKVCARLVYQDEAANFMITYMDTRIKLDLDAILEFAPPDANLGMQEAAGEFSSTVDTLIDITGFLCGTPGENEGKPYTDVYGAGQSFRVCVDITTAEDAQTFQLDNFQDVICRKETANRFIIESGVATSVSTNLYDTAATVGATSYDGTRIASEKAISFSTAVTIAMLTTTALDADAVESRSMICQGKVAVSTMGIEGEEDRRRSLVDYRPTTYSFSFDTDTMRHRKTEEDTGEESSIGTFGTMIPLTAAASSSTPRFPPIACMIVTIAIMMRTIMN